MGRARISWPGAGRRAEREAAERAAEAERRAHAERICRGLRDTRVARGLSIADVERDTRIGRLYLEAIEACRFETLPAPVYARGFVRAYARYLGLDPDEAVEAVPVDLPRPVGLEPLPGLRRTTTPILPALNAPLLAALGVAAVLVLVAFLAVPRLGGRSGLPDDALPGTPTATATSTVMPEADATVPPFASGETPNFIGVTRETAQALISQIGLIPVVIESPNAAPRGRVFAQSPEPGEPIAAGGTVTLFVSQGP